LIRQLLASLVVLGAAFIAWAVLAPGAQQTLASYGIALPFVPASQEVAAATPGRPGPGGPGGGGGPGGFGGRTTNVVTTPVTLSTVNDSLTAVGEARAARSVTVSAPAGGTLQEILVRPGEQVEAGTTIARLESATEQIAYDRAVLAADDARATFTRQGELARSNLVANSALNAAQLALSNAELELRGAELALERREIVSPIAGTVGLMQVTPGNYLAAQTAVTTVEDTSSIDVDFWVPERYAPTLDRTTPVSVSVLALPGETFTGEITAIDNRVDSTSRTLQVQASVPNPGNRLRAGMSLTVEMRFPGTELPTVDPLSILWSAEGSYVWKYQDGTATRVMAEIVQRNSDGVLVVADLEPGDPIITEGILQLSEGTAVNLLDGPDGTGTAPAETAEADQPQITP
jgi:RND family efflux transporter MFP subunit